MKWYERPLAILLLLAAMTAVLLHASWHKPYYEIDDEMHVTLALTEPWQHWFTPSAVPTYFPVTLFSYWVDHQLFGWFAPRPVAARDGGGALAGQPRQQPKSSAPAMRLMNGVYHLLAGWLLWMFLRRIGAGAGLAACVALLWTGHPLACESVCWVSERKNVLCALFGFGALLAWTAERGPAWWSTQSSSPLPAAAPPKSQELRARSLSLACLLYALAGLSKPAALGLLPVFVVLELLDPSRQTHVLRIDGSTAKIQQPGTRNHKPETRNLVFRLAPLLALSVCLLAAGVYTHRTDLMDPPGGTVFTALLTDAEVFARYAVNIICPVRLSFFYGVEPIVSLGDPRAWCYGLGLLAFCGGLVWAAGLPLTLPSPQGGEGRVRGRVLAWLGVLWFFGALAPNSNLVAIPFWMQDRYVYLASAGLLLALGAAAMGMFQRARQERFLPALAAVAVVAMASLGAWRARSYASYAVLTVEAAQRQPGSAMAQLCAANVLRGIYFEHARKCEGLAYESPQWREEAQMAQHYATEALAHYQAAGRCTGIEMFVDRFTLRTWAAEVLAALGRYDDACALLGPLPPQDLKMLPDMEDPRQHVLISRKAHFAGYPPRTLAGAWLIRGEASLRRCATPGITAEQKKAWAEQSRQEAAESMKCHKMDHEAYVLWARAQMLLADLSAAGKDMPTALNLYNQAVAKLKQVPPTSLSAYSAQRLLDNVPPPKASGE
jgi:hypothetical protein